MTDQTEPYRYALGIDTATNLQCLAVLDGETLLDDCKRRVEFDHSSSLLANLSDLLAEHDLSADALDAIGVGIGPGSFVGTRIGLSLAKGLARQLDIPLAGASSLACLAYPQAVSHPEADVVAAYDARRDEVYTGTYTCRPESGFQPLEDDRLIDPGQLREHVLDRAEAGQRVVVVGNATTAYEAIGSIDRSRVDVLPAWFDGPSPVAAALLGRKKCRDNGGDALDALEPNYIRASSAEENLKAGKLNVGGLKNE